MMTVVDKESYVLDGVIYEIPLADVPFNDESAQRAVAHYKAKMVDAGIAFGKLDKAIEESIENEMSMEEFASFQTLDPIAVAQGLQVHGSFDDEEVINEQEAAFQLLDIIFDPDTLNIFGRIHLLDTPSGRIARANVDAGMKCIMSQASVDEVVDNKDRARGGFNMNQMIRKIRGGWRLSFEKEDNVDRFAE